MSPISDSPVLPPRCALCGHLRVDHQHRVLPFWSKAETDLWCKVDDCVCDIYVAEPTDNEAEQAA